MLRYAAALVFVALLALPAAASAASESDAADSLPFTWAELAVLAGVGAALVLFGFSLRRITRRSTET